MLTPLSLKLHPSCSGYCDLITYVVQYWLLQLIDFGLSKHLESVATLGVGTPDYMPPEMLKSNHKRQQQQQGVNGGGNGGTPPYDAKAVDAWAMGVVLYLLLMGVYPFEVRRV